jgi:hypothetical protein
LPYSNSSIDLEVNIISLSMAALTISVCIDALKSLLIIARTPSPEPAEEPVPEPALNLDNLNPTQKSRLERFLRELVVCTLKIMLMRYTTDTLRTMVNLPGIGQTGQSRGSKMTKIEKAKAPGRRESQGHQ